MAADSPARRGAKDQQADTDNDPLNFNLYDRHEKAFTKFKKVFGTIIGELHVPLAGNLDAKKCKTADDFAAFCERKYGVKALK